MRTARSTCGIASSDSKQTVASPTPTAPMTQRRPVPAIECTLYPNSLIRSQTASISCFVA